MKDFELIYKAANECIRPSEDFKQRTLDRVFESEQKKPRSGKKLMLLLVAAIIAISAFMGTVSAIEYYYSREEKMSLSERYSSLTDLYTEKVEVYCEAEGLKVTLTEALYDNGVVTVNFIGEYNGKLRGIMLGGGLHGMYINGEYFPEGWIGSVEQSGDKVWTTMDYDLSRFDLTGECEITVIYPTAYILDEAEIVKEVNHQWEFTFTVNTGVLTEETVVYRIDQEYIREDGRGVYFDSMICTPVSQMIVYKIIDPYYSQENPEASYFPAIRAVDPSRRYEFMTDSGVGDTAKAFNLNPDGFDLNAKRIELTVYIDGRTGNDEIDHETMKIVCVRQDED